MVRLVAKAELGVYASHGYVETNGRPSTPEALSTHRISGFSRSDAGSGGSQAFAASQLFGPQTAVYTLEASVSQSLFDGGTLYHKTEAQKAAFDQAAAKYRSTVIRATESLRTRPEDSPTFEDAY